MVNFLNEVPTSLFLFQFFYSQYVACMTWPWRAVPTAIYSVSLPTNVLLYLRLRQRGAKSRRPIDAELAASNAFLNECSRLIVDKTTQIGK